MRIREEIQEVLRDLVKATLIKELVSKLEEELTSLEAAAKANRDFATDQEFKAESKYDTRSLEAAYLASAEAKRVEDLKLEIQMLTEVDVKLDNSEVGIGSLVELQHQNQKRLYFVIPTAGGTLLNHEGTPVLVVSVFSPLGAELLGTKAGEEFEIDTPKETRSYKILRIE